MLNFSLFLLSQVSKELAEIVFIYFLSRIYHRLLHILHYEQLKKFSNFRNSCIP